MTDSGPTLEEIVELGAVDSLLFTHAFFPKTVRQQSPEFHKQVWKILDNPTYRQCNVQMFRGSAKTSITRMCTAKRIAYGLAHTILYIGKSEQHAVRSVRWLKNQVMHNRLYADTFQLRPGKKWQDVEVEIQHGIDEYPLWIMAMGITGSVRGVNQDDFRPDFIVLDDVLDEENSATPEQRNKIENLVYGAVLQSLTPRSEAPDAKLIALQTPQNREDFSTKALKDPSWKSVRYACWTPETLDKPIEQQESAWETRYPTPELRKEKAAAIARNQNSIWAREMECRIVSPETSAFRLEWLQRYELVPEGITKVMVIDPVPPPSEIEIAKGLRGKDYEAFAVVGRWRDQFYLLDYRLQRGHEPDWTIATFFEMALRWRPREILVETVAYQKTLSWLLKKAMDTRRQWYVLKDFKDKRSKFDRIVDGLSGVASAKKLYALPEHSEFFQQFGEYPDVPHDDLIEAVAIGVDHLNWGMVLEADDDYEGLEHEEENVADINVAAWGAP